MHRSARTLPLPLLTVCLLAHGTVASAQPPGAAEPQSTEHLGATPFVMQGFGDVNYVTTGLDGEHGGFRNGALDLFATSQLGDRWSALAELVFESDGNTLSTDLERFQFTYEQSDALRLSAGRMHNPFLRWPVTFHHGLFTQTPVDRPIMARWEDEPGLWPMHFVGLIAQGRFGRTGLNYALGAGNGRGRTFDEVQVTSDANGSRAVVASVGVTPDAIPGFAVSVSGYFDRIPATAGSLRERDFTASGSYVRGDAEIRAEWSRLRHEAVDSDVVYRSTGWYVLGAYRLSPELGRIKPYLLIENVDVAEGEPFFEGVPDEAAWAAGIRWDASRWVALKGDYRSRKLGSADREGAVRLQLAVNF